MPVDVTDVRSNPQDQIAHAARVIGHSADCRRVFSAIYKGKKKIKTVAEIVKLTSLPRIRVLQEAGKLCDNEIANKNKIGKELAYEKYAFYTQNKDKVLKLAGDRDALERFPTKTTPKINGFPIHISFPKKLVNVKQITVDDIGSFVEVRSAPANDVPLLYESEFKEGLQKILGEEGTFQDWGGETDDLFSTRLVLKGERKSVAFGLKGKATKGILTPKKMGRRGDQIQRLFRSPADVFIVQYRGQIDESIIEQMKYFAIAKSALEGRVICYGVIDGGDTARIVSAYPQYFS